MSYPVVVNFYLSEYVLPTLINNKKGKLLLGKICHQREFAWKNIL